MSTLGVLLSLLALAPPVARAPEPTPPLDAPGLPPVYTPALVRRQKQIAAGIPLDLECWKTILIDQGALCWRKRWPIARPFAVSIHLPTLQDGLVIELRSRSPGWKPARGSSFEPFTGCMAFPGYDREDYQELGLLAPDQREVLFDLRVSYALGPPAGATMRSWQPVGTIRLDVQPVPSVEKVLRPVTDPLWGARLVRSLSVADADLSACLFVGELEWPRGLGRALDVSLVHEGRMVDASELWLRGGPVNGVLALERLPRSIARGVDAAKGWTLRLQGTPKRLLRTWSVTQYWAGEIEVPLAQLIRR